MLRHHYGINPETLSDAEWAKRYQEYQYVKTHEHKMLFEIIEVANKKALAEILSEVLKK